MQGPSFPSGEAAALFAALEAHYGGDTGPILRWHLQSEARFLASLRRWAPASVDAEDLWQELEIEACRAVRGSRLPDSPGGWLSRVSLHILCRRLRRRQPVYVEGAGLPEDIQDPAPSPPDQAADRDGALEARRRVLEAAHLLPRPYGHVLCWRVLLGVPWQGVLDLLQCHRPEGTAPIRGRRARKITEEALAMGAALLGEGVDPRSRHPHMYRAGKNRWMCAPLPPLPALGDAWGPQGAVPGWQGAWNHPEDGPVIRESVPEVALLAGSFGGPGTGALVEGGVRVPAGCARRWMGLERLIHSAMLPAEAPRRKGGVP